jgi:DNA mismatch endonuclease (patch repair protein)
VEQTGKRMADVFTAAKRSEVMSKIRGRGNKKTELALIALFHRHGITGWRRNQKVFGKPDFVFWKVRVAVFVDGCFWHGCSKHCTMPDTNRDFWEKKLRANRRRDREVNRVLRNQGWKVLRIWEHALVEKNERRLLSRIRGILNDA